MKIKYLGTSGGDGIPALFCDCRNCNYARKHKGKNIRTTQQAVIDNKILIDIGPDTFCHSIQHNLNLSQIENCIITHNHKDHFYPSNILMRKYGKISKKLNIYATENIINTLSENIKENDSVMLNIVENYKEYVIGKYNITPLRAKHGADNSAVIYLIGDGEKTLLYGHDTGEIYQEVYKYLQNKKIYLDFVSLDCTCGFGDTDKNQHMNVGMGLVVKKKLFEIGSANNNTLFYFSHFSHNHEGALHDTFLHKVKPYGFLPAYDGLEVEL